MTLPSFVGRYEVQAEIARGAFAVVFKAWDEELECFVALKILHDRLAGNSDVEQRFLHEARLLRRVHSPQLITVHDIGRLNDGRPYFVMDFADRGTLNDRLQDQTLIRPISSHGLTPLIDALGEGLKAIHQAGLVHRDIKPENLLLQRVRHVGLPNAGQYQEDTDARDGRLVAADERVIVGDLGIAKDVIHNGSLPTLVGGTPLYLAPEQNVATADVTTAVDIYSATAVLWRVINGTPPPLPHAVEQQLADIPGAWQEMMRQGLAADPAMRFADIDAWRAAAIDALEHDLSDTGGHGASTESVCPYKGLAAYQTDDARFFCGRETLVDELIRRLQLHQVLVVGGPSGSGKSSLVRAGLFPALKAGILAGSEGWQLILMTPGHDPVRELKRRLRNLSRPSRGAQPANEPVEVRDDDLHDARAVIFVDQFEELFTLNQSHEREAFFALLAGLTARAEGTIKLIIAVRADFYGACAQIPWLAGKITNNQVLVGPMTQSELRRAVSEPARRAGLHLEQGLVEAIITETGAEAGSLPLMAHALVETWVRRRGNTLTLDGFHATGGVAGAISQTADAVYKHQLDNADREVAKHLFLRLIAPNEGIPETRRALPREELERDSHSATMSRIIEQLTRARLLTVDEGRIQIAHEALLRTWPRLRTWIEESRDDLRMRQKISHAATEWTTEGREQDLLYRGTPLLSALEWMAGNPGQLGPLEREFLTASERNKALVAEQVEEKARRARRWRRAAIGALIALAAGTSLSSLLAYRAAQDSQKNAERAASASARAEERFATALGSAAFGHVREDPRLALALATEAMARAGDSGASYDTRAAIVAARRQLADGEVFPLGGPIPAGEALAIALNPDGSQLAIAQASGQIDLVDTGAHERLWPALVGHEGGVRALEYEDSGQRLVSAGVDGTVRSWTLPSTGRPAEYRIVGKLDDIVPDICIHPNQPIIASASTDGTVRLWDAAGLGEVREPLARLPLEFNAIEFTPDGSALLAATNDAAIHAWSLPSGKAVFAPIEDAHSSHLLRLHFNPRGDRLATVSTSGGAAVIAYPQGRIVARPFDADAKIGAVTFTPDGKLLIGGDDQGRLRLWDTQDMRETGITASGHSQAIVGASLTRDGLTLATLGGDQSVRLWSLGTEYPLTRDYATPAAKTRSVAFHPRAAQVAAGDSSGQVWLWDRNDPAGGSVVARHGDGVWAVAFAPAGDLLASADRGGSVHITNLSEPAAPTVLQANGPVWSMAMLDDGGALITASDNGVTLWRLSDSHPQLTIAHPAGKITRLAVAPDGKRIATSSTDGTVRIYDVTNGVLLQSLAAERDTLWSLAFSPDGTHLATASGNEVAAVWDLSTGQRETTFGGHAGGATDVAFLRDGLTLVVTDRSGDLHWWDIRTRRKLTPPIQAHTASSWRLAVHPDGATVATAGDDGRARVWDILDTHRACVLGRPSLDPTHRQQYLGIDQAAIDCKQLLTGHQLQQ